MNREQLVKLFDEIEFKEGTHDFFVEKCADIAEEFSNNQIEETAKNGIVELMESIPNKVAGWMMLIFAKECVKCNAEALDLSTEADIEGKRYNIKTTIEISEVPQQIIK